MIDMNPHLTYTLRIEGTEDNIHDLLSQAVEVDSIGSFEIIGRPPSPPKHKEFNFRCPALECGHGQDFRAVFSMSYERGDFWKIESVDVMCADLGECWYAIGGVGGEISMECPRNSDGSLNFEQMCRDWIGAWHRRFNGETEDSITGMYRIIKQIVSEGHPENF